MAIWTDRPETFDRFPSYRLLRTPTKGKISGVVLSHKPAGTLLHYWKGRSNPCNQTDCEACKAGHRPRWKGYLFLAARPTRRVAIFEYTERAQEPIDAFLAKFGTLKGAILTAERLGTRANSPLGITFEDDRADIAGYPEPDGLEEILERMWENRQKTLQFEDREPAPIFDTNGHRY